MILFPVINLIDCNGREVYAFIERIECVSENSSGQALLHFVSGTSICLNENAEKTIVRIDKFIESEERDAKEKAGTEAGAVQK